jgi:hypothetical protein
MAPSITPTEGCWKDVEDVLSAGIDRLILFGPPGTGKTFAGLNYGIAQGEAHRLVCTDDMTNADVTGAWMPNASGTWSWHDGAAIKAWSTGGRLVVDEIDKAGGDVFATLLAMTDTIDSAKWEHPETGRIVRPAEGFSVVMTTNVEDMDELPTALKDRFPVAIRVDRPHPAALEKLASDIRPYAMRMADAGHRRISLRSFYAFDKLRMTLGEERAAAMVFGHRSSAILDAIRIDRIDGGTTEDQF